MLDFTEIDRRLKTLGQPLCSKDIKKHEAIPSEGEISVI